MRFITYASLVGLKGYYNIYNKRKTIIWTIEEVNNLKVVDYSYFDFDVLKGNKMSTLGVYPYVSRQI